MHTAWFVILAWMLTAYAVLDGFDFGAGIVHLFVAKTDEERRSVFAAIGPVWDGNEVWLIASGGVLIFAFPRAYAAAFSGLYLPLMIVLWLLILRGLAIEFRSKVDNPLWRAGWDATFASSSSIMAVVLGVALGNVVRGVPLDQHGYFHEDLFATIGSTHSGAVDPFTAMFGLFSFVVLAAHGAAFLAWKTPGDLSQRCRRLAQRGWILAMLLVVVITIFAFSAQPVFFERVLRYPWLWLFPACAAANIVVAILSLAGGQELRAFLASCGVIASMMLATAGALYPVILRSTIDSAFTLDIHNAASERGGLRIGFLIWLPAILLAVGYFAYLFWSFRGKTTSIETHD